MTIPETVTAAPPTAAPAHPGVIAAMFDDRRAAEQARDALIGTGIDSGAIDLLDQPAPHTDTTGGHGLWQRIRDSLVPHAHAHGYAEGVERGHAMMFVHAPPDRQAEVMHLLEQLHPIDMMLRVQQWTDDGWSGVHRSQPEPPRMLFADQPDPGHLPATGLLNERDRVPLIGSPLVNPMGIEVPGQRWSGTGRVRRYEIEQD